MDENLDLLEFLKYILDCMYTSDLRIDPYNEKAKEMLKFINFEIYPMNQIRDAFEYIFGKNKNQ
jgi:hypothetical protein